MDFEAVVEGVDGAVVVWGGGVGEVVGGCGCYYAGEDVVAGAVVSLREWVCWGWVDWNEHGFGEVLAQGEGEVADFELLVELEADVGGDFA